MEQEGIRFPSLLTAQPAPKLTQNFLLEAWLCRHEDLGAGNPAFSPPRRGFSTKSRGGGEPRAGCSPLPLPGLQFLHMVSPPLGLLSSSSSFLPPKIPMKFTTM